MRRARADGGRARRREDAAGAHPRRRAVGRHPAGAVHARPDARRHHRLDGDRQPAGRAQLPRGPDLHQPAAGRRDQPDAAQDPVRAAGGDGGGPGLGRRRLASAARGRSWSPRPRTRSSTRAPTRCPRRSSTGSCSRWCCRSPTATPSWRSCAGTPPASTRATWPAPAYDPVAGADDIAAGRAAVGQVQVSPRWPATSSTSPGRPASRRRCSLGVSPRGATALLRAARAWAWLTGRDFVTPDDVKALAHATLVHRLGPAPRGRARGRRGRAGARLRARLGAGPPVSQPMSITGRVPLLLLLGLVPVVLRPEHGHGVAVGAGGRCCWSASTCCSRPSPAALTLERPPVGVGPARASRPRPTLVATNDSRRRRARRRSATRGSRPPAPTGNRHRLAPVARRPGRADARRCCRGAAATCARSA